MTVGCSTRLTNAKGCGCAVYGYYFVGSNVCAVKRKDTRVFNIIGNLDGCDGFAFRRREGDGCVFRLINSPGRAAAVFTARVIFTGVLTIVTNRGSANA